MDSIFTTSQTFNPATDAQTDVQLSVDGTPYAATLEDIAPGITDKIDQVQQPGESWMDTLQRSLPNLIAGVSQYQLLQVQLDRARAGLPPLDMSQYAAGVQVGVSPEVKNLMYGAGLLVGGIALLMYLDRR